MANRRGNLLMTAGALLLAGALMLTCVNVLTERVAADRSAHLISLLDEQISGYTGRDGGANDADAPALREMQTIELEGREYIGVLDIPSLNLSLPVLKDWSYSLLRISPCRYAGSFLDDSMILAGHNYRKHFGTLNRLRPGDEAVLTDVLGNVYFYEVTATETIAGTDTAAMEAGDWDLTLFTCTMSGRSRITVRCERTSP